MTQEHLKGFHASVTQLFAEIDPHRITPRNMGFDMHAGKMGTIDLAEGQSISISLAGKPLREGAVTEVVLKDGKITEVLRQFGNVKGVHHSVRGERNGKASLPFRDQTVFVGETGFHFGIISLQEAREIIDLVQVLKHAQ